MKYLKLFEEFSENEPAVIVNQLKEIDKIYRYLFEHDEKLQNYDIDTTNITEKEGINYWYNINLFELKNQDPIYYWKIFINITLDDYVSGQDIENAENAEDALAQAEPAAEEAPLEEPAEGVAEEEAEETSDEDVETPSIEECFIKISKYDLNGKLLVEWSETAQLTDVMDTDWLVKQMDNMKDQTLKIPKDQKDVDKVKKRIKEFDDLDFQ